MCPASHSSLSRTSSRTTPLPLLSVALTSEGSTSSTWLRIWRMTSAPDGLMRMLSLLTKRIGIQYFRKDSAGGGTDPAVPAERDSARAHGDPANVPPLSRGGKAALILGAVGVVFGDIGTSPL